jgi:hypothetical protein
LDALGGVGGLNISLDDFGVSPSTVDSDVPGSLDGESGAAGSSFAIGVLGDSGLLKDGVGSSAPSCSSAPLEDGGLLCVGSVASGSSPIPAFVDDENLMVLGDAASVLVAGGSDV